MKKILTLILLTSCLYLQAQDSLFYQYKVLHKEVVFNNSKPIEFKGDKHIFVDLESDKIVVTGETDNKKAYTRQYNVYDYQQDYKYEMKGVIINTLDSDNDQYNWHIYSGHEYFYCVKPGDATIIERFKVEKL